MKKRVLLVGCHCDDIELGCGATVFKHRDDWQFKAVVLTQRNAEGKYLNQTASESLKLLGVRDISLCSLDTCRLADQRQEVWNTLTWQAKAFPPDLVVANDPDEHQDHAATYEEILRVFRHSTIATYEISRSGPTFAPNAWEIVDGASAEKKVVAVASYQPHYPGKTYLHPDKVLAQLRHRGTYVEADYAEAFRVVRMRGL